MPVRHQHCICYALLIQDISAYSRICLKKDRLDSSRKNLYFEMKYGICVDLKKPNSVQNEYSVPLEKQHFIQLCSIFVTENLHKC